MIYFCIIFISPLYFIARKKWGGFILNSFFYGIACMCILTFVGVFVAPIFWMLAVGHASFTYRKERTVQHAELIASKLAEKIQNNPKP